MDATLPSRLLLSVLIAALAVAGCATDVSFTGEWEMDKDQSSDVNPWRGMKLDITAYADTVSINRSFLAGRYSRYDSVTFVVGTENEIRMDESAKWLEQPHLGVHIADGSVQHIRAEWADGGRALHVVAEYPLETSQDRTDVRVETEYRLNRSGKEMTVTQTRSSRSTPQVLVFRRSQDG